MTDTIRQIELFENKFSNLAKQLFIEQIKDGNVYGAQILMDKYPEYDYEEFIDELLMELCGNGLLNGVIIIFDNFGDEIRKRNFAKYINKSSESGHSDLANYFINFRETFNHDFKNDNYSANRVTLSESQKKFLIILLDNGLNSCFEIVRNSEITNSELYLVLTSLAIPRIQTNMIIDYMKSDIPLAKYYVKQIFEKYGINNNHIAYLLSK